MEYCFSIEEPVSQFIQLLGVNNVYPVGGTVRDIVQGKKPKDYDFAITDFNRALKLAQELGLPIHEDGLKYGVIRIGDKYDFATMRREEYNTVSKPEVELGASIYEDARRRDFTINSMYGKITSVNGNTICFEPIDFFNGMEDLKNRVLRFVGNPVERINEDPIRILRAIRFMLKGYQMPPEQQEILKEMKEKLNEEPVEKIRDELTKILLLNPAEGFKKLQEFGLLNHLFRGHEKAMSETFHDNRGSHYGESVLQHTYDALKRLTERGDYDLIDVLATLYHDVAKPYTRTERKGKIMFIGHDEKGQELAEEILRELRFDNNTIRDVTNLIGLHMKMNMNKNSEEGHAKIIAELAELYNYNPYKVREMYNRLIKLSEVDTGEKVPINLSERITPPVVNGKMLMEWFGVGGEVLRHLKKRAYELQLLGYTPEQIYRTLKGDMKLYEYLKNKQKLEA